MSNEKVFELDRSCVALENDLSRSQQMFDSRGGRTDGINRGLASIAMRGQLYCVRTWPVDVVDVSAEEGTASALIQGY